MSNKKSIFYETIAQYYEDVFPVKKPMLDYMLTYLPECAKLLDVGCATGAFSNMISPYCSKVDAFDANLTMIDIAKHKQAENVRFHIADMLEVAQYFPIKTYDVISCFGNTLVHLLSLQDILLFLQNAHEVLKKDGCLLLQILNYDAILDRQIKELPLIDNEKVNFIRTYEFQPNQRVFDFYTKLFIKEKNEMINNVTQLYAIRPNELCKLLEEAGFVKIKMYSSFKKEALDNQKLPLVIEAFAR